MMNMTESFVATPQTIAMYVAGAQTSSAMSAKKAIMRNQRKPGSVNEKYLRRLLGDVLVDMFMNSKETSRILMETEEEQRNFTGINQRYQQEKAVTDEVEVVA